MRFVLYLVAFVSVSNFCFSQDSVQVGMDSKYQIGIKITLDRSGVPKFVNQTEFGEQINFGVPVYKRISKIFQVETGVYYVRKNSDISILSNQSLSINYSFENIRLPLMVRLETKYFYTSIGLYGDYFIEFSSEEEYYKEKFDYEINKLNAGLAFNFGIESKLTHNFNLFLESGISRDLTAFVKNGEYFKFLNYGFSIGTTIEF